MMMFISHHQIKNIIHVLAPRCLEKQLLGAVVNNVNIQKQQHSKPETFTKIDGPYALLLTDRSCNQIKGQPSI